MKIKRYKLNSGNSIYMAKKKIKKNTKVVINIPGLNWMPSVTKKDYKSYLKKINKGRKR